MTFSFPDTIERNAFRNPRSAAIICEGITTTWSQLWARCNAFAGGLNQLGLKAGDRVAYLGLNSEWYVESYFGPALAGIEIVPMNYRLSQRELRECLADCGAKAVIADSVFADFARGALETQAGKGIKLILVNAAPKGSDEIGYEELLAQNYPITSRQSRDDDTLIIYYTGGTTGKPKGVMLSHWNVFSNAIGTVSRYGLKPDETHLMIGPMFYTAAGSRIFTCVQATACLVIQPKFEVEGFLRLIQDHKVDITLFVPTMMQMILDHPAFSSYDLSSLRQMTWGASAASAELLRRIVHAFPKVDLYHAFGMTEASPLLTVLGPEYHRADFKKYGKLGSVGQPVGHCDVRIFGPDGTALPNGEIGEIVARGPNIMKGYLSQPQETAEALRGGWYHTGDAGYFDSDGFLWVSGRIKDMIISGGENVYPADVENVISAHEGVAQVAVIGIPDPHWGEVVYAIVVRTPGVAVTEASVIEYTRTQLAHYKCPRRVVFRTEPMPLSAANKVLKTELRKAYTPTLNTVVSGSND